MGGPPPAHGAGVPSAPMGVRLTVDGSAWRAHVIATADGLPGLVPVVKGNGYGFGRVDLARRAVLALGSQELAVGTVHEVAGLPVDVAAIVLTPTLDTLPEHLPADTVLTVGAEHHVTALARQGWRGRVVVKLASRMRRYGTDDPAALVAACHDAGLEPVAASLHLPLVGDADTRRADIEQWLPRLDALPAAATFDVSHVDRATLDALRATHPHIAWRVRLGTELWHGDKSFLHLGATVVDVHPVTAGEPLGYRQIPSPLTGHVALVAAGSAHGVQPLAGGLSPFHHARRRLPLVEPPHMHTSMVLLEADMPPLAPGEFVDLQHPLILTTPDEIVWT